MDMHELEQAWNGLDARLERQDVMLERIQRRDSMRTARARLRLVSIGQLAQLAVGVLIVLWAGGYWFDHLGETHLVIYGVAVHLYGLALLIVSALQLVRLSRIDYREPVLDVQRQLVAIRKLRIASERLLLILGFVAWVPIVFIALRAIGVDVWETRPAVVLWNLAIGVGLAGFVAWLVRRFRDRFERDAAGRSLSEAEADLAELARSERGS